MEELGGGFCGMTIDRPRLHYYCSRTWIRAPEIINLNSWNVRVPRCDGAVQAMGAMYELKARLRVGWLSRNFNRRDGRSIKEASEDAQYPIMCCSELRVVIEDTVTANAQKWLNVIDCDLEDSECWRRARARSKRAIFKVGTWHARFTPPLVGEFVFNAAMLEQHWW